MSVVRITTVDPSTATEALPPNLENMAGSVPPTAVPDVDAVLVVDGAVVLLPLHMLAASPASSAKAVRVSAMWVMAFTIGRGPAVQV